MKKIDSFRINKALKKSSNYLINSPVFKILQIISKISLKGISKNENNKSILDYLTDKERLELTYLEFDKEINLSEYLSNQTPQQLKKLQTDWNKKWLKLAAKKWKRDAQIKAIQQKYQVSGLELVEKDFNCGSLKVHQPDKELEILSSDLKVLKSERLKNTRYFLKAAEINKMKLYRKAIDTMDEENWILASPELILKLVELDDWATIGENKYYTNDRELERKGFTILKSFPQTAEDRFNWELHLRSGKGDPNNSNQVNQFRAKLGEKIPCL